MFPRNIRLAEDILVCSKRSIGTHRARSEIAPNIPLERCCFDCNISTYQLFRWNKDINCETVLIHFTISINQKDLTSRKQH
jgi:hypothetical protein